MLVLSRHIDEQICIGDDIVLTIVSLSDDRVRIGITAPIETPVHRREIYERIRRANGHGHERNAGGPSNA